MGLGLRKVRVFKNDCSYGVLQHLFTLKVKSFFFSFPLDFLLLYASHSNRVMRGIRLVKLMRILRLSSKTANVDFTRHFNPSIVRLIKLLAKIVFGAHLLGCMWFIVDECDVDGGDDLWQTCGGASLRSKVRTS